MKRLLFLLIGSGLLLAGACRSSGRVETRIPTGPVTVVWEYDPGTGTTSIRGPVGTEVCFTFLDEDGEPLGDPVAVTIPGKVAVPPGGRAFQVEPCEAEEPVATDPEPVVARSGLGPAPPTAPVHRFWGGPLVAEADEDLLTYSLAVRDQDPERARAKHRRVVALGTSARPPRGLEVSLFAETRVDSASGRFLLRFASPRPILALELDLNDTAGFADLDDAVLSWENGWNVASFSVPLSAFHLGLLPGTYTNTWEARYELEGAPAPLEASGAVDLVR